MSWMKDAIDYIVKLFQLWVTIMPWEGGIRVFMGKEQSVLNPGLHIRIPVIHSIYRQETRLRVVSMPVQTVTTLDRKTITIILAVGYKITDITKLYNSLYQPEATISNIAMSEAAAFISATSSPTTQSIEENLMGVLKMSDYGISFEYVKVLSYADVRTFRLIQDYHWTNDNLKTDIKA